MIQFNELENLKIYRTKVNLVSDLAQPNKFNLIMLNTMNLMESKRIMGSNNMKLLNFRSYFIDRIYTKFKVFNKPVNLRLDSLEIYKEIKEFNPRILGFNKEFQNVDGLNVFFDMHVYNTLFFEAAVSYRGDRIITEYITLLNKLLPRFTDYTNKLMVFDLNELDLKDKTIYNYTYIDNAFETMLAMMKRFPEQFKTLGFDIIVFRGKSVMKIETASATPNYQELVKNKLNILSNIKSSYSANSEDDEEDIGVIEDVDEIVSKSKFLSKFNFDGDDSKMSDVVKDKIKEINSKDEKEIIKEMDKDKEFLKKLEVEKLHRISPSILNSKRNKLLEERQAEIKINKEGKSVKDILKDIEDHTIETTEYDINTNVENMKKMTFPNFENEYNKKLLEKDTVAILNFFKDRSIPVYILDIKKEDTSDEFDKKYTYTIKMESADRQRHTLTFDIPKFVQDKFLYLGGNKKSIVKQLVLKPVSKTGPNTVQVCTNYNKIFISRNGSKISPKLERLVKILAEYRTNKNIITKAGNNGISNLEYCTTMEYDDLGTKYMLISVSRDFNIYFNQKNVRAVLKKNGIPFTENDDAKLPIGYIIKDNKKIALHLDTNKDIIIETGKSISDTIIEKASEKINGFEDEMNKMSVGKRFIYSQAKILRRDVPLILFLSSLEGLSTVMRKAGIKFEFSDTRKVLTGEDKNNKDIIQFSDGYLIYDRYPMRNSLLMNGLSSIPTREYSFTDMDSKDTYLDIFGELLNLRMIVNAFNNFYDLLIDPITKEVLIDLDLPTDFVELILYANQLLEDSMYTKENNMTLYRARSNEIVNAYLYKSLAKAYEKYSISASNKNPVKMSIPRDEVIKNIVTSPIVEDYSTLNPVLEAEKLRAVTYKGPSGMNMDRAYTLDKRSYDKSMRGILSMSSPSTASVGVIRQFSVDANVTSPRGYLKLIEGEDELKSSNMFGVSELLIPMNAQKDDSPRTAMATTQSKHVIPCKKYNSSLIGNGCDKVLGQIISDDFAFKAKFPGKVIEVNEEVGVMVVQYNNKDYDVIDISNKVAKNGGGGFYINNKLTPKLKVNQSFKKNDILAINEQFFDYNGGQNSTFKVGTMAKIAITSGYFTYEDSAIVTNKLCDDMSAEITMKKEYVLGKNSNILNIVKKGQEVSVGDPLMTFDTSYEDEGLNKLLANMDKEMADQITNLGRIPIKSKYSGTIEDVKMYSTVEQSELSPSIQKAMKTVNDPINQMKKVIEKYKKIDETDVLVQPVGKIDDNGSGKIKGIDVGEGVLIEFYIKYKDRMGIGDKFIFLTALKSIICEVIPEGLEPYSEFRPDEEISAFLSPISVLARMTGSIMYNMFSNKLMIELKRKVKDIYNNK